MATYNSTAMGITTMSLPGDSTSGEFPASDQFVIPFSFNIANTNSAAGFANGDILNLFMIPADGYGNMILDIYYSSPAIDTAAATATLELGDTGSEARYVAAGNTLGARATFDDFISHATGYVAGIWPRLTTGVMLPPTSTGSSCILYQLKVKAAVATPATTGVIKGYAIIWSGTAAGIAG